MMSRKILALALAALLLALSWAVAEAPAPRAEIKAGDVLCFGAPDETSGFGGR